jgi:hypothetical protein
LVLPGISLPEPWHRDSNAVVLYRQYATVRVNR